MTENEKNLIDLIRNNNDTEKAITTAIGIIASFLVQLRSSEEQDSACPRESA